MRGVLIVAAVLLWVWAGIWVVLFPALLINDADNGRFAHDFETVCVPEFGLAFVGAVLCTALVWSVHRGPLPWRALGVPVIVIIAVVLISVVVLPVGS